MANEKRLIDAKAYCMELYDEMNYPGRSEEFMAAIDVAIADLADAPNVDAVEVVRCKDCKFGDWDSEPHDAMVCMRTKDGFWRSGNDFCSFGELKEGSDNGCQNCGAKMDLE